MGFEPSSLVISNRRTVKEQRKPPDDSLSKASRHRTRTLLDLPDENRRENVICPVELHHDCGQEITEGRLGVESSPTPHCQTLHPDLFEKQRLRLKLTDSGHLSSYVVTLQAECRLRADADSHCPVPNTNQRGSFQSRELRMLWDTKRCVQASRC